MFFTTPFTVRLTKDIVDSINKIIEKDSTKYDSVSHFIRCSIIEKVRAEK